MGSGGDAQAPHEAMARPRKGKFPDLLGGSVFLLKRARCRARPRAIHGWRTKGDAALHAPPVERAAPPVRAPILPHRAAPARPWFSSARDALMRHCVRARQRWTFPPPRAVSIAGFARRRCYPESDSHPSTPTRPSGALLADASTLDAQDQRVAAPSRPPHEAPRLRPN